MTGEITKWTWERAVLHSDLSSNARLIALVLNAHASVLGEGVYPGRERIMRLSGVSSPSTFAKCTKELVAKGFIVVEKRREGAKSLTNLYHLMIPGVHGVEVQTVDVLQTTPNRPLLNNRPSKNNTPPKTLGTSPTATHRDTVSKPDYPVVFESTWASRPRREGPDNKRKAYSAWNARKKAGSTPTELHEGLVKYTKYLEATGKLGTRYVMHTCTFFGPDRHYLEDWSIPAIEALRSDVQGLDGPAAWEDIIAWIRANGAASGRKWPHPADSKISQTLSTIGGLRVLRVATERDITFKRREFLTLWGN